MSVVSWPCGDASFLGTIRARFYLRRLSCEQVLWLGWVAIPLVHWASGPVKPIPFFEGRPEIWGQLPIWLLLATWLGGWWSLWGSAGRFFFRGAKSTAAWRAEFAKACKRTETLAGSVPLFDRTRDASLRSTALEATAPGVGYVYMLSSLADVSFTPRHVTAASLAGGRAAQTFTAQLVLELVRLGGEPVLFRDSKRNIIAIWQVDKVVQFWAVLHVEELGNEIRVSEKTGYQWWIPWDLRSSRLGVPLGFRFRNVTKSIGEQPDYGWPLSRPFAHPLSATVCAYASLYFPLLGVLLWIHRALAGARARKRFETWHNPELGDSLDLALLQNERALRPLRLAKWTVDSILNHDGHPTYPDILQRIDARRELVGAAVTQALEETINSPR